MSRLECSRNAVDSTHLCYSGPATDSMLPHHRHTRPSPSRPLTQQTYRAVVHHLAWCTGPRVSLIVERKSFYPMFLHHGVMMQDEGLLPAVHNLHTPIYTHPASQPAQRLGQADLLIMLYALRFVWSEHVCLEMWGFMCVSVWLLGNRIAYFNTVLHIHPTYLLGSDLVLSKI